MFFLVGGVPALAFSHFETITVRLGDGLIISLRECLPRKFSPCAMIELRIGSTRWFTFEEA